MNGHLCMPSIAQRLAGAVEYAEAHVPAPLPLIDARVKDVIQRQRDLAAAMGVKFTGGAS